MTVSGNYNNNNNNSSSSNRGYGGGYNSRGRGGGNNFPHTQGGNRPLGNGGNGGSKGINNRGMNVDLFEFRSGQPSHTHHQHHHHHHHHSSPIGNTAYGLGNGAPSLGGLHHSSVTSPQPPQQAAAAATPAAAGYPPDLARIIPVPEDRIYSVDDLLIVYQQEAASTSACPPGILSVARMLWKGMPEHFDSIGNLRDRLFAEDVAAAPSKVLQDRKLYHEVMGILGKVTEANLDVMRKALTDLPIRQSSKEEIHEVIDVFFNRSTRPEDSRYTPLYVNLIVYLIEKVGKENAGEMIRTEIISQCKQRFFEGEKEKTNRHEEAVESMSAAEAEAERMKLAAERKANIFFLGLMFVNKLVTEPIIVMVLDNLLYGFRGRCRTRHPAEADVVLFMELLQTCGPHFSESQVEKLTMYRVDIDVLSKEHPRMRAKVLLQNLGETMDNNWVPLHGQHARKSAGPSHPGSPGSPAGSPTFAQKSRAVLSASPPAQLITREDLWKAMDEYFQGHPDELDTAIDGLPSDRITTYFASAIGRYIVTVRYETERHQLGELFTTLVKKGKISADVPKAALMYSVQEAIDDDIITDLPRYFEFWTAVVSHGGAALPPSLHAEMLRVLVEKHVEPNLITKFLKCVETFTVESSSNNNKVAAGEQQQQQMMMMNEEIRVRTRLHTLPGLLRYTYPLFSGKGLSRDDQEAILAMGAGSVEVSVFRNIEEAESSLTAIMHHVMKENYMNAYPFLSAFFTYIRFNLDLMEKNRAVIKKVFSWTHVNALLLLEDVYIQWSQLECEPEIYISFIMKIKTHFKHFNETIIQLANNIGSIHHDVVMERRLLQLESSGPASPVGNHLSPPAGSSLPHPHPSRADDNTNNHNNHHHHSNNRADFVRKNDAMRKQRG